MRVAIRFLVIVLLLSVAACDRSTFGYAGTPKSEKGSNAPEYTVQPKLNQPTKTM